MDIQPVWEYFRQFDDGEAYRISVLLMFVFGTPLIVGVTANLWIWAIRQMRAARRYLQEPLEVAQLDHGRRAESPPL